MTTISEKFKNKIKGKEDIISFDFLNKQEISASPKKSHKKNIKALNLFIGVQFICALCTVNNFHNMIDDNEVAGIKMYNDFQNLTKITKEGNQEGIVIAFSQFVKSNNIIGDLFSAGFVLTALSDNTEDEMTMHPEYKKLIEQQRYKATPETQQTLVKIYKANWDNGMKVQREKIKNYKCMFFDVSCWGIRKIYANYSNKMLDIVEKKVNVSHYNVEHIEEYKKWRTNITNIIRKNDKLDDKLKLDMPDSPGNIVFPD